MPFWPDQFGDDTGDPLAGGSLYTYQPGTTTTQLTYADSALTTPNANPIVLDSAGRATVYLNPLLGYKFILKNSLGVTIKTLDNAYSPPASLTLRDTDNTNNLILAAGSNLTADRTLTLTTGDADRTLTLSGNPTLDNWFDQAVKSTSSPTFASPIVSTLLNLTAGQIAFPATQVPSAGANTLDDYEEGLWTPTDQSGAALSITNNGCQYVKIGQFVMIAGDLSYPATGNGSNAVIGGLPFTSQTSNAYGGVVHTGIANGMTIHVTSAATTFSFYDIAGTAAKTNANLTGALVRFTFTYRAAS